MSVTIEPIKPLIGGIVHVDKPHLLDDEVVARLKNALDERGVLVFPQIALSDDEQLSFTDKLGGRTNFTRQVPGSDSSAQDVYKVTLDKQVNTEPEYVLGTFFWHVDGISLDVPTVPKATVLSARRLAANGGATEFASLYAAYEQLPEAEKRELAGLRVVHSLEAAMRPVWGHTPQERIERYRGMAQPMDHPLVWTHATGRKSLLIGTQAEAIVGWRGPEGRALLTRLQQWAAQPDLVYRHEWSVGDLVIWDNEGLMHRVVPYSDEGRVMHRTSIAGTERPGRPVADADLAKVREPAM